MFKSRAVIGSHNTSLMFDKFKSRFLRRKSGQPSRREQMRTLEDIAVLFETLDKFAEGNLIYYDEQRQMVVISHVLANFYLYNETNWQVFLGNVYHWAVFKYTSQEYARLYNKAMADAEAKAYAASNPSNSQPPYDPFDSSERRSLLADNRRIARMQAAAAFDDAHAAEQIHVPDMQIVIINEQDGQPIVVAARKDGRYETYPVSSSQ